MNKKIKDVFKEAALKAILEMGFENFKKCSFFGSNDRGISGGN